MASQSLYRKWRSQTFSDLVGQEAIIKTLKNALHDGKLAHAYLFTGPRGTGKTSMARLLAKTINCLQPQNGEPCNTCEQCREITIGNSFNVIEIDAASNRGIDSIRELREKVMVPPSTGKYKVYILDEAHMLTVEAFNALLKTLEEPPPHAIFVMATTDVHKMLPTVLSRCQRFDFKRFTTQQIVERLRYVAGHEQVKLESGSAELIARAAAGGMRDALSLLDQAIAYSGSVISLAQVQAMLGVADPRAIQKFVSHIASANSPAGLHLIHELAEAGADLRQINSQIAEYFRAMMLARAGATVGEILDVTEDEVREIIETAGLFALDALTECARIFAQNELVQKSQGTPQLGLELAFLACVDIRQRNGQAQPSVSSAAASTTARSASAPIQDLPPAPMARQSPTIQQTAPTPVAPISSQPQVVVEHTVTSVQPAVVIQPPTQIQTPPVNLASREDEEDEGLPDWGDMSYQEEEEEEYTPVSRPAPIQRSNVEQEKRVQSSPPPAQVTHAPVMSAPAKSVQIEEPAQAASVAGPQLKLQDVREKWELVLRRVKSKKDGPKISAFLKGFSLAGVEGTDALPVIVIRANMDFHYKSLQNESHHAAIEWALKVELQQECKLRLLPPATAVALNSLAFPSTRQSAYREPPPPIGGAVVPPALPPPTQGPVSRAVPSTQPGPEIIKAVPVIPIPREEIPPVPPLARNDVMGENRRGVSSPKGETRLEMSTNHAKNDHVIQEAMRMFKADIKDVHLK